MIQMLTVAPDSAAIPGLPGLPAGDKAMASFTALMAEAILMAGAAEPGRAGVALRGGQGGLPGAPALPAAATATPATTTEGEAGAAEAALLSLLSGGKVPLPATPASVSADTGATGADGKALAAETETETEDVAVPALPVADPAAASLAMPALAGQSVAMATPALPSAAAEAGAPAVPALPATPAAPAGPAKAAPALATPPEGAAQASEDTAVAVEADSQSAGKKLPQPMAVLAARQMAKPLDDRPDTVPVGPGQAAGPGLLVTAAEVAGDAPVQPTAMPALERTPVAPAVVAAPAALPGHEAAALLEIRHQAVAASPDRVVIGMQNGFGTAAWQQELGDKVVWMAGRQGQMAELVLNPPSLGAVEVRLNLSGGEASAQFFSANPNVRDALESALPRLREMMGGAGIVLGEASVSDQSFGQRDPSGAQKGGGQGADIAMADDGMSITLDRRAGTALLDFFA